MTPAVLLVVLVAGVLHATWNAMAKALDDRLVAFSLIGVSSAVCGADMLLVSGLPNSKAMPFAIASAAVHLLYEVGLMQSYRLGSFNQTYPLARGTAPLVVALGAYLATGERLGAVPAAGIAVLAVGLMSLAVSTGTLRRANVTAVVAAVLTGSTIAGYTLLDGLGVRHSHDPVAYAGMLFVLYGPVMPIVAAFRRPLSTWRPNRQVRLGLGAGVLTILAYGMVLWAQTRAPLAEVAALRETGVIAAAIIGLAFLHEEFGRRRIAAALLVAAGIVLIGI